MGDRKVKETLPICISFPIPEATMYLFEPFSRGPNMTVPVATRNENLTRRDLG